MRHLITIFLLGILSMAALADGPLDSTLSKAFLERMKGADDPKVTQPLQEAACGAKGKSDGFSLRPDSFSLYGGLDFAKLLPATRNSGLNVDLGGTFTFSYTKGTDYVKVQAYVIPTAGYSVPLSKSPGGKQLPADVSVGLSFNCATNPNASDYMLSVGAGGATPTFHFGMNSSNFFTKALLAPDKSSRPRSYSQILSTLANSEKGLRKAVDGMRRYSPPLQNQAWETLVSQTVPRWSAEDPAANRPLSYWLEETLKASRTALGNGFPNDFSRKTQAFLARLKTAPTTPLAQAQLNLEVGALYQDLTNASHELAKSTFPLVMGKERSALLKRSLNVEPRDPWLSPLHIRPTANSSAVQQVRQTIFAPNAPYRNRCADGKTRFLTVYVTPPGGRRSTQYVDCFTGTLFTSDQFRGVGAWMKAQRSVVEEADRHRAALGDLTHLINNSYAQYLSGQAVRPEALQIGGVHTGNVFTGCIGVSLSVTNIVRTGGAAFRQASALAHRVMASAPTSPAALTTALATQAAAGGYPGFSPSAALSTPYRIGTAMHIPLCSLPRAWSRLITGECGADGALALAHASRALPKSH